MARDASQIFWEQSSARLAVRINFAAWLERLAPAVFAVSTAVAIALYSLRRHDAAPQFAWWAGLGAGAVAAVVAWWRARPFLYRPADARVLLESSLRLDARLSAAADGVTPWPARVEIPRVVRWRSLTAPGWLVAALALLAVGGWAPIISGGPVARRPVEKPPALAQTEAMLEELAKVDVADPASVEQLAAQARELADRTPEEQYSHSGLEAADTLRDQTMAAAQSLARSYDAAAGALAPFEARTGGAGSDESKGEGDQLAAALDGLRTGRLAGNRELTSSAAGARQLSPEQIKQLRSKLNQAGAQARGVAGAAGQGANIARPGQRAGAGPGGLGGGEGESPLTMNGDPTADNAGLRQRLEGGDLEHASIGDFAGVEYGGAHQVDPSKLAGPGTAGAAGTAAPGGEAVWIDRLSPSDRTVLRDFFK